MTSGARLPPRPLKKHTAFGLRKEAGKTHKTEWTNSLIACTHRLGNQKRFLTDPNFDLDFTRRRTCPAMVVAHAPAGRGRAQPEGSLKELQLTPTRRKAQLQQLNPWLPLRWCSHTEIGYTVKLLFPSNLQPCVETQILKITLWNAQNIKQGTSSLRHHQMKNHDHRLLHWKTRRSQQAHGTWRHLLDPKLLCELPSATDSICPAVHPQDPDLFQSHSFRHEDITA